MSKTQPVVAYFSAEYAIADDLPIYAGGLGVLAADIVLEAAAEQREFYGVGLVYHQAFTGDDPDQRPLTERLTANGFAVASGADGSRLMVEIMVGQRPVKLQAWVKHWEKTHLVLLDAAVDENDERDRAISDHLYAKDPSLEFAQQMCLGLGGVKMLEAMGAAPDVYHMNEGHAAIAGLALVLREKSAHPERNFEEAAAAVRPRLVGTKHTILAGAGLILGWDAVAAQLEPTLVVAGATLDDLKGLAGRPQGDYSDTHLMVGMMHAGNGVSKLHVQLEKHDHAESKLIAITNGVYAPRWGAASWGEDPLKFDDAKLWALHCENRRQLLDHVREQTGAILDPDHLTVVWARRMAAYKRPGLLLGDLDRLAALVRHSQNPVQFVVAGRPNPSDAEGVELMNRVIEAARRPDLTASFAYLPHYDTVNAKFLVRGADLWLNTPVRGFEACGTSGMKASLNGALQFSTSDGWVDEVNLDAIGWELPEDHAETAIYDLLEREIAPRFYRLQGGVPVDWVVRMRANIKLVREEFTAERMLGEYYSKLYVD